MIKDILNFLEYENIAEETSEPRIDNGKFERYDAVKGDDTIVAVDGGCSVIVDGGTWNISKIKIASVSYKSDEKLTETVDEYTVAATLKKKKVRLKIMPPINLNFQLSSADIEEIPNLVRSILEWKKIKEIAESSSSGTVILRDGAFGSNEAYEKTLISDVFKTCEKHGVELIGICKTCRISTDSGRPIVGVVNEVGSEKLPNEKWVYSDSDLKIVKFHEKSGFCFRLEAPKKDNLIKTIGVISYYSKDPEILGYPYPLLKADKVARVKAFEKEMENTKVKMLAKSLGKNFIETDEKSTIMHSLLDRRAYR